MSDEETPDADDGTDDADGERRQTEGATPTGDASGGDGRRDEPTGEGPPGPNAVRPLSDRLRTAVGEPDYRRDRVALWVVAFLMFVTVAFVVWRYVGTVILGLFVYYVTRPVFERVHERIESRTAAVVVTLATVAVPVLLLVGWTVSIAVRALTNTLNSAVLGRLEELAAPFVDLSGLVGDVDTLLQGLLRNPSRVTQFDIGPATADVVSVLLSSFEVVVNVGIHAFIVIILTFYLLRDDHRMAAWGRGTFVRSGGPLEVYLRTVDRDLKNVFFGNILNALLTGMLAVVTYVLLNLVAPATGGVPRPALVGLLVGAGSLVPVIGIKIVWVPVAAYLGVRAAVADPGTLWFTVLFAVVSTVIVDYIPDQLLRPYVSGRTLHVGLVMLAYTIGPLLFGWYGIFLGPFVLVVVFEFVRIVVPWLVNPEAAPSAEELDVDETADDAADDGWPGWVSGIPTPAFHTSASEPEGRDDRGEGDGSPGHSDDPAAGDS